MKAVIQRVSSASVTVAGEKIGAIGAGLLILLGVNQKDREKDIDYLVQKTVGMRIFKDNNNNMNLSVKDIGGEVMVVSQFTLCGDTRKGNRPSYINAMNVADAEGMYSDFLDYMYSHYRNVKTGTFQADMDIELINDGPVTLFIRSKN